MKNSLRKKLKVSAKFSIHIIFAILFIISLISGLIYKGFHEIFYNIWKYLTNWSMYMTFIYSLIRITQIKNLKWISILFNINFITQTITTGFFWIFLFSKSELKNKSFYFNFIDVIFSHTIPLIYLIIELFKNQKIILKYYYTIYCIIFIFLYFLFNFLVYFLAFNEISYSLIDYKKLNAYIILIIGLIYVIFANFILVYIKNNLINKKKSKQNLGNCIKNR